MGVARARCESRGLYVGVPFAQTLSMPRALSTLLLCLSLSACTDTLEDRLADLDARATFDCGEVGDCTSQAKADAVTSCLREKLAAGIPARALFVLGLDPIAYVYALDGAYVYIEGDYYDGPNFTEYRCPDVTVSGSATCSYAHGAECTAVRDWYE